MQQQRSRPLRRARELIRSRDGWPPLTQAPPVSCCLGASLIALSNLQTIPLINILVLCSKVTFFINFQSLDICTPNYVFARDSTRVKFTFSPI